MPDYIEEYLRQIKDNPDINQWDTLYTHLDAKEPLGMSVRLQDERGGRGELDVKDVVAQERRLIISGASGMGKTTTLKWLTLVYAENYLGGAERLIPLYVDLGRFRHGLFYDHALMIAHENGLEEVDFKELLDDGKLAIFLDGLDLLGGLGDFEPTIEIRNFMSEFSRCKFVLSSRPGFFEGFKSSCKVSELVELDDPKIKGYIHKYLGEGDKADTLINRIFDGRNERLKLLCKNPMMLHLIIELQRDGKIADDRAGVYRKSIEGIITHYREKGKTLSSNERLIKDGLKELAFSMQKENTIRLDYGGALDVAGSCISPERYRKVSAEQVLEDCFRLGLLRKDGDEVRFGFHQSFQEYFAAVKLKEIFECGYDISESFSHPKWEDTLIFLSEIAERPDELFDDVIGAGEVFLAAKLTLYVDDHRVENLCARLLDKVDSEFDLEVRLAVGSFTHVGDRGANAIVGLLGDEEVALWAAMTLLGEIDHAKMVSLIVNVLERMSDYMVTRLDQISGVGRYSNLKHSAQNSNRLQLQNDASIVWRDNPALEPFLELPIYLLKEDNPSVQSAAATALGKIGEMDVELRIDALKMKMKSDDPWMRMVATRALGKIRGGSAVEPLIDALHDNNSSVRWEAAIALKPLCGLIHIEQLNPLLKSDRKDVASAAFEILHSIELKEREKIKIFRELKEKPAPIEVESGYTIPSVAKDAEDMLTDAHLGALIDRLKLVPDSITVVDYGCGKGALLGRMKEIERELGKIHYIGVDLSRGNRYLAGITAERYGVADKLKSCYFMDPDEFFSKNIDIDHVFFSHVIHEIFLKDLPEILYHLLSKMKAGSRITILEQRILVEPESDFVTWDADDFDMLFSGFAESSPRPHQTGRGHELISVDLERLDTDVSLESIRKRCLEVYGCMKERALKKLRSPDLSDDEHRYQTALLANIDSQIADAVV